MATQVARAAGLKNPSHAVANYHRLKVNHAGLMAWDDVKQVYHKMTDPVGDAKPSYLGVQHLQARSWIATEAWVYAMLLKGRAAQSEPFRRWVTEEVLPTIRKTGSYSAEESANPIAVGVMDELKTLRLEVGELKALIQGLGTTTGVDCSNIHQLSRSCVDSERLAGELPCGLTV